MSEDEAVDILQNCIADYVIGEYCEKCGDRLVCANKNEDCCFQQAIETILDLYQKEKEKNKKLQKRNDRQFRLLRKKDKEIQEIKDICEHDWEERCRLTFKFEDYIRKDKIKAKIEGIKKCKKRIKDKYLVFSRQDIFDYQIYILQELLLEDN